MVALKTEHGALARRQIAVPTAAVGERRRSGITARRGDIPAAGNVGRLTESQLNRPAADGTRPGVGHGHVHLITGAPVVGIGHFTSNGPECARSANGQKQSKTQTYPM